MKASGYNIIVEDSQRGETIIYNSLYGSMAVFENEEFDMAKNILEHPNGVLEDLDEIRAILVSQKYLIDDEVDEMAIIENRKRCGMEDKNRLDLIIMPTLDCNFSCIYCYEDKKPGKMTSETMTVLKKWMSIEIPKYKLVLLSWFGGEPLLGFRNVEEITNFANEIAKNNAVELITHITTNGYALTKEKIRKLIHLNILNYQITIDGIAETHDKLRPLRNGKETFEKVFENIILLASESPHVKITLRVNFNHTNLYNIPVLLELFPKELRNQLRLSMEPIFGSCEYNATDNLLTEDISRTISSHLILASELGYDIVLGKSTVETGKLVYCYAERENQVIVNYNNDVFKCSVFDFDSPNRVGHINQEGLFVKDQNNWDNWMNIPLFESVCTSCKYLPLCMGGCRKTRIQNQERGSACSLIPTNASYILKQISYDSFKNLVIKDHN